MDLRDFVNLEMLDCCHNQLTSMNLDNCLKLKKIICSHNKLTELSVDNLSNLVELQCSSNQLTNLDVNNCNQLEELGGSNNYLENLKLPYRTKQLICLGLSSNNFPKQDLSRFSHLTNLKDLDLGNWYKEKIDQGIYNRFVGSLEYLKNLSKLEHLDINNTDISSGAEYLPNNWLSSNHKKIFYSVIERPESKLKEIVEQLTNFLEYGLCKQCKKVINGCNKCQHCNTNIDRDTHDFIQKYEKLKWIPYEQFTEIEKIGEGGFSKVYKTKWINKNKIIVLKSLNNSRDINKEFLREIANHQILFNCNMVVKCYGISQDPQTSNYLIVMDYMKDGDLREFLRNNWLSFEDKLENLLHITWGLNEIHNKKIIHRDFHVGNILKKRESARQNQNKCYITDLGLSRSANNEEESKVYGVLPYIAPEILRGEAYTQASDIYSFAIIVYEILTDKSPYQEHAHDEFLALQICQGLRPNLDEVQVPQLLKNLIKRCWDANPERRPKANELVTIKRGWLTEARNNKSTEFTQQYQEAVEIDKQKLCRTLSKLYKKYKEEAKEVKPEEIENVKKELFEEFFKNNDYRKYNEKIKRSKKAKKEFDRLLAKESSLVYQTHPQAIYTSRLLDFPNLPQPQNCQEINQIFYKLTEELEALRISDKVKFSEELKNRFKDLEKEIFIVNSEEIAPIKTQEQYDWTDLNPNLTDELIHQRQSSYFSLNLISQWESRGFSSHQIQDWINIGLQPTDYDLCTWLRDHKCLTFEQVLNFSNYNQLKQEYQNYQQIQVNIEQSPK